MSYDKNLFLHLHPSDNIFILKHALKANCEFTIERERHALTQTLEMGHKIAKCDIPKNSVVLKYGAPIGRANRDIMAGEHVHLHNLASNYTVIEDMKQ